jgi:DNA-binding NarL/FixJ family response regulator
VQIPPRRSQTAILARTHLDVLHWLVAGESRLAIATALHTTPRAVDLRVVLIKHALGTSYKLCLGVRAVRYGLVKPQHPIAHAIAHRTSSAWLRPTVRQHELLGLFADGASVDDVAEKTGMSVRTVRGEISHLAAANGARNGIHAGALFEAHGWV